MNFFKAIFQNIAYYISKILPSFTNNDFKEHLLLAVSPQVAG